MADDHPDDHQNRDPPRRKGRGVTKLSRLIVRHSGENAERLPIEFDNDCNPVGEFAAQFVTYIGVVARRRIDILIDDWRSVPEEVKNDCMAEIAVSVVEC